jgi:hypothetical protein
LSGLAGPTAVDPWVVPEEPRRHLKPTLVGTLQFGGAEAKERAARAMPPRGT